ncbi:MAG: hypothetical protein QOF64_2264 [Candidatus Binatota bacterium]|jgi:hypothetical protein|nr:hypothetical protein [Candidatus Binatota bacterium]
MMKAISNARARRAMPFHDFQLSFAHRKHPATPILIDPAKNAGS